MDLKEHYFQYNPFDGHPDKITNAPGYQYFFLGNGFIEAAIQYNISLIGSPLGILIWDPIKFGKKSDTLTYNTEFGLEQTLIEIKIGNKKYFPSNENLKMFWDNKFDFPVVSALWNASLLSIKEEFYCPDNENPIIIRNVILKNMSTKKIQGELYIDQNYSDKSELKNKKYQFTVIPENEKVFTFIYSLDKNIEKNLKVENTENLVITRASKNYWQKINYFSCENLKLNHLFNSAKFQIAASVSDNGMMDASIWQYNLEWVRDLSNISLGMITSGHFEKAKKVLTRLLSEFVDEDGSTIDSSRKRPSSEVELDQNGILLYAVWMYTMWTGDFEFCKIYWEKLKLLADYLLKDIFWDKESKLLKNCREYWERHIEYGVTQGYELTYQLFPIIGLEKISELAKIWDHEEDSVRWQNASNIIKDSFLNNEKFKLIEDGHFIKRRKENGEPHIFLEPPNKSTLPSNTPLKEEYPNPIDPDTCEALPIAFRIIDPKSALAFGTLENLEKLWNQRWDYGGYSRYNVKSEPDSPGPWPFATMFVARAYLENENSQRVKRILEWMYQKSPVTGSWFEFYGWRPSPPCPPVSIIPWTWAEIIVFFVNHFLGIRPENDKIVIQPKILDLSDKIEAKIRMRNSFLNIKLQRKEEKSSPYFILLNDEKIKIQNNTIEINYSDKDQNLQIFI